MADSKINGIIRKAVASLATATLFTATLFFTTMPSYSASSNKGMPDFAYPKTVATNAEKALSTAVAHGDWANAVKALTKKVTADNLVSNADIAGTTAGIDSICRMAPDAWKPAFLLLKADIYNRIYQQSRWQADQRKLALNAVPESPYEWSRDIFADKTYEICSQVLADNHNAGKPVKEWGTFLTDTGFAYICDMSIDEYTALQCFRLTGVFQPEGGADIIPFFKTEVSEATTPVEKCSRLRDKAIERLIDLAAEKRQSLLLAYALNEQLGVLPNSARQIAAVNAYERVKGTDGEQLSLMALREFVSDNGKDQGPFTGKEYVEMMRKSVVSFPKGRYANALRNIINDFTRQSSNIIYKSQYLSSQPIVMDVTISNSNESWALVFDYSKYANAQRQPKNKEIASNCTLVKAAKITAEGEVPFSAKTTAEIGTLPAGLYVVIPSATASKSGIYPDILNDSWREPFRVSDISVLTMKCPDATTKVFVVDGVNGKPIEGAKVNVYSYANYNSGRKLAQTLTTDSDGSVTISEQRFEIEASYNGSKWSSRQRLYNNLSKSEIRKASHAEILADRSIYHPGDSIDAVAVAYISEGQQLKLSKNSKLTIKLHDANGKETASADGSVDGFGRMEASFCIPKQGLPGNWRISAYDENGKQIGNRYFQVADYVAPTFFITADENEPEMTAGAEVRIKGLALTYSGMPVSDAKVNYEITYSSPMRWFYRGGASYNGSVITDGEGRYEIVLPTENLKGTSFEKGVFDVKISATSPAGETQQGPNERFALGKEYRIATDGRNMALDLSGEQPGINFFVFDMLGRKVSKELSYRLINDTNGETSAEGKFMSPRLGFADCDLASAVYRIEVALAEDSTVNDNTKLTLWRKTDKAAPAGTGLWVPEKNIYATPGENMVRIPIGSGKADRWIPGVLSDDGKVVTVKWLHVENDNVSMAIDAPKGGKTMLFNLNYISDLNMEEADVTICSAEYGDNMEITTESFRNKVSAGDSEKWTFRFSKKYGESGVTPAIAVMTDKALNAIAPFNWNFAPQSPRRPDFTRIRQYYLNTRNLYTNFKKTKYLEYSAIQFPRLQDYDKGLGLSHIIVGAPVFYAAASVQNNMMVKEESLVTVKTTGRSLASAKMAAQRSADGAEIDDLVMETEEEIAEGADAGAAMIAGTGAEPDEKILRETECPVAFFKPYLTTDQEGMLAIDFTVPNFNTTWAFQMIGYDESLQTAKIALEAVASKPVMTSTHAPRFLRTGDKVTLTATIYNNSGEECDVKGRLEVVDLISGKTLLAKDFGAERVAASGNRLIAMEWTAPDGVSSIGFRSYAESGNHKDGEQAMIPVLPATSPVVESTPFWIAPEGKEASVKLPKFKSTDQVTLQYCDNPAWYCLTALPDIVKPDTKSITAKAKALFGNATAYHLIASSTSLKKGLEMLLSDKNSEFAALKSNLEKDGNLKIAELNNTPWVNNAASETLRMSRLETLLDSVNAEKNISGIIEDLHRTQTSEGGWSWCPEMKPSEYITSDVVRYIAMCSKSGALDGFGEWEEMTRSAVGFVDSEKVESYRKYHDKTQSLGYLLDWIYIRGNLPSSLIPNKGDSREMEGMIRKALKDIASEWKDYSIYEKAKAAIVLGRAGRTSDANAVLESLRQYASVSDEKGMWFDNLKSDRNGLMALRTTTLVLEAFNLLKPGDRSIDLLRQWLVLGRQYQDWGKNSDVAETVNAILTTGTDWTEPSSASKAEFQLGDISIDVPATAALTGAFTMTLTADEASKKTLKITRSGASPAWGGVISQYVSPINEVKPASVPDLTIEKRLVALVEKPDGSVEPKEGVELRKGMKVRVTLLITAGRDLDYVAVTDERSACLEPEEQLSGMTRSDGDWFYKEVRDAVTNLYFDTLTKGSHVVSYDCRVSEEGDFSCGIATAQSQYSPLTTAHTGGSHLKSK